MNGKRLKPIVMLAMTIAPTAVEADTVQFYQKRLPNTQSVTVTRTEVPKNNELTPQQKAADAQWLKDHPGYFLGPTSDHRYRYTYLLTSANGKQPQVLWTNEAETFGAAPLPGQTRVGSMEAGVLDVAVENSQTKDSETLIVLYKGSANIVRPGPHGSRIPLTPRESHLAVPVSGLDGLIVSGKISGALSNGDLTATLTSETGKVFVYHWQGHAWSLVSNPAPMAAPSKSLGTKNEGT